MARQFFGLEKGVDIYAENGASVLARILTGTAVPDGLGDQSSAPIGSIYLRSGTGELYQKIANAGNSSDWQLNGASAAVVGTWRGESVVLVTNDTQAPGVRDVVASPFTDDNGTAVPIGEYVVGKYIIADADGTPSLLEITNVAGNNVTFAAASSPLAEDDTFVVRNYLPDSDGLENSAIVNYNGSIIIKIADVDWNFADGIQMAAGYTAQNGTITSADSVNSAIEKLDGNQQDLQTLTGVAQGSTNLGAFAAPGSFLLTATETIKSALQKLADYFFGLRVIQTTGVQAATVCDQLAHATYKRVVWHVEVFETATPANREGFTIEALTDGSTVDSTKYARLKLGSNIGVNSNAVINGANLELSISATPSCTVNVRRLTVV